MARIKLQGTVTPDFDGEAYADLPLIYQSVDEGPNWNRVIEVRRDIFALRSPTYVIEWGAPIIWGTRYVTAITKYIHLEKEE